MQLENAPPSDIYVQMLTSWLIYFLSNINGKCHNPTIAEYGLIRGLKEEATEVWLDAGHTVLAHKICAIGVHVSRFVTMHSLKLNVNTDMRYFNYINPCGFATFGVTSIQQELGREIQMEEVKTILKEKFNQIF